MKMNLYKAFIFSFFLLICQTLFSDPIGKIKWTDSFLNAADQIPTDRLQFGYITVPENYEKPDGKKLKVAFVVIRSSLNNQSSNDASIYFMGGWGARTITNLHYYQNHFLSYKRDLILYDYRGTGYSEPTLCDKLGTKVFEHVLEDLPYTDFETKQRTLFNDCLNELESQGIDYNQYGTDNRARDGVLLAEELKYEAYNLFGVSYGTKTILQFIRQSTVKIRTIIMDSNCPLDYPINSGMTGDYAQSLYHILEDCQNDLDCNKKYPELRERFETFLISLDAKPLKIRLPNQRVAYLNKQEVNGIIHQLLYNERIYSMMPFLLDKFIKRNKFIIKRILGNLEEVLVENYNGVGLINYVYDHKPFREKAISIANQSKKDYPNFHVFDGYQNYFFVDQRFKTNLENTTAINNDIPTLIMAGGYDPITPVYYSKMIQKYFSNHFYVEFPRTGHGVTDNQCGRNLAENFLNNFQNPDEDPCYGKIKDRKIVFER